MRGINRSTPQDTYPTHAINTGTHNVIFMTGVLFYFKYFSNYETFSVPQHLYKFTIVHFHIFSIISKTCYIWVHYNEGLLYLIRHGLHRKHCLTVLLLVHVYLLTQEHVYQANAYQKMSLLAFRHQGRPQTAS